MRTRSAWTVMVVGLLAGGIVAPSLMSQAGSGEKGNAKGKVKKDPERAETEKAVPGIRVTITGTVTTESAASESTGTEMTVQDVRGIIFELDLSRDKELAELARKLNGKPATAKGTLEVREGRFRRLRFILRPTELKRIVKEVER